MSSSTLSPSVSSESSPEHSLVALVQKTSALFLLLLQRTPCICQPAAKSSPTVHLFIVQDGKSISLYRSWQQESLCCCFLRDASQGVTVLMSTSKILIAFYPQSIDNLLTAVCIHEMSQGSWFFSPTLLSNLRAGGQKIERGCPLAITSLAAREKEIGLLCLDVWVTVRNETFVSSCQWVTVFISLG